MIEMPEKLKAKCTQPHQIVFYVPFLIAGLRFTLGPEFPPNTGIAVASSSAQNA